MYRGNVGVALDGRLVCGLFLLTLFHGNRLLEFHETLQEWLIPSLVVHIVILFRFSDFWRSYRTLNCSRSLVSEHFLWALFLENCLLEFHKTSQEWLLPSLVVHIVILFRLDGVKGLDFFNEFVLWTFLVNTVSRNFTILIDTMPSCAYCNPVQVWRFLSEL